MEATQCALRRAPDTAFRRIPMADHTHNGNFGASSFDTPSIRLKLGLAEMLKGGVIMDVMNVEQARIAEEAGAISVMALERVPAMIRAEGGVARSGPRGRPPP